MSDKIVQIVPAAPGVYATYTDSTDKDKILLWGLTKDGAVVGMIICQDGMVEVENYEGFYKYVWEGNDATE